jgi:DNA-binding transcriptional LysR family regulator
MTLNSTHHLELVLALAQHRHFGRAAKALGVSQPSLTRSLKHLEETLRVRLFDRGGQDVTPTLFGRIVIERGELLIDGFSELAREIALAQGLEVGELKIAVGPYPAHVSAQKAVGQLAARHPNLSITIQTKDWLRGIDDVLANKVDLAFCDVSEALPELELELEVVRTSQLRIYCRVGHPLHGRSSLDLTDLMQFPWVAPTLPGRLRAAMPDGEMPCGAFEAKSGRFRPRILVDNISAAIEVVVASDALSATLPFLISDALNDGQLVLLPIMLPWMRLNYGFIWRRGRTHSPAANLFMNLVRAIEAGTPE